MAGSSEAKTAVLKVSAGSPPAPEVEPLTALERTTHDYMPASSTIISSPLEALERDEIMRTRKFCAVIGSLLALGVLSVFILPGGDPLAKKILIGGIALGFAATGFLLYRTKDPVQFRKPSTALGWFFPAFSCNSAVVYFGVFSPAPMVVVLGVYFLGLGKAGRVAIAAYIFCALAQAVAAFVTITRIAPDIGLMRPSLDLTDQIIIQVLVQVVLLTTIVTARMSRRTALVAVGELEQAVRLAAHRQALLLEAREALDRALREKRGKFSGQVISHYELRDILGRGGMGEVYDATDNRSGAQVAIKLLSQASLGNAEYVLRFLRELRTAAGVTSPHVVRVIEVGEHPVPYLVMERLEGATLSEILRDRRTLPPAEVVELIFQIGIGISAAATAGIVHRDLKPQNVFRDRGTWKVLDFGVARGIDHGDTLTAGQIVGTPSYMAPEQATGAAVDHLTDLYALAAIAYRALTGHPPFSGGEVAEMLYRVVHTRPTRPTLLAPDLHRDVDLVLAVGLAPRPEDRFQTAGAFADALRDAFDGKLAGPVRDRGENLVETTGWGGPVKQARRSSR